MTNAELKAAVKAYYDGSGTTGATADRVRLNADGTIDAFGEMPNANRKMGWWYVGRRDKVERELADA